MHVDEIDRLNNLEPIDRLKLRMEYEKIKLERLKTWGTVVSIIIPLILAAATVFYGMWSQNKRAKIDFEIKATEIVMNATSPTAAINKAEALITLFPQSLPPNFQQALQK